MIFEQFFTTARALMPGPYADVFFLAFYASTIFTVSAVFSALGGLAERKIIARVHSRIGPMYTGYRGILQTVADLLKFLQKEVIFPQGSDRFLFKLAPLLLVLPTFLAFLFLPIGSYTLFRNEYGLLFILALLGIGPIAILIGAWASNSKYSTLGGLRAAGMMMSYEVLVVVAAASIALTVGSFDMVSIVNAQESLWFAVMQPVAFILFIIGIIASVERNPFDLVEAESELVAGWKTEYGGIYFALTLLGEYMKLLATGILFVCLFLGGWTGPLGDVGFVIKVLAYVVFMFYVRATAIRLRLDQIFEKVWRRYIPLGLVNFIITMGVLWTLGGV